VRNRLSLAVVAVLMLMLALSTAALAYNEAPMLAERVKAGLLPPVEERLPENPLVLEPIDGIGKYGGTWYRFSNSRDWGYVRMLMYGSSPVRWVDDGFGIEPNWVERWESNEDKTVWTFHIRKGIKWSDGHPFTAHDFLFWWEDMANHPEMSDVIPDMLIAGGKPADIVALDDYTLQFTFAAPAPILPERMACWVNNGHGERYIAPKHYLSQFHPDYNPEYKDFEVFEEKMEWWFNPECPTINEWIVVDYKVAQQLVLERNPYYYAVDPAGNQLPYIDRIVVDYVEDQEVIKLKLLNGEGTMQVRPYLSMTDLTALKRNEATAGYRVILWDTGSGTGPMFYWNWNHPDDDKRELFRNKTFRRALSIAIDRPTMQKMLFFGLGEITTGTLSPKAIEYHRTEEGRKLYEEWRWSWAEYNPEKAKQMLDSIGVIDRDGDGWREMPNGKPLTLRIDRDANANREDTLANEMVKANWEAIGIRTVLNPVDGSQLSVMDQTATFEIRNSWEVGDGPNHVVFPQWLVPIDLSRWAPLNGSWYAVQGTPQANEELDLPPRDRTPPREEPEPDSPVRRLQALYDKLKVEPDEAKRDELVLEMVKIHIEEGPFFIGTVGNYPRIVVVSNKMRNVPDREDLAQGGFVNPWIIPYPAVTAPCTYWLDE